MAQKNSDRRVLVTGGTGFIGRACAVELRRLGFTVYTAARKKSGRRGAQAGGGKAIEEHQVDLFDRAKTKALIEKIKPTDLLHCAWDVAPGSYWNSAANLEWVEPSIELARDFAAAGGKRMVGIGTCAEYSWGEPVLSEKTTPCVPASVYGQAKLKTFSELSRLSTELGVSFGWARLFFLFGPGEARGRLVSDAVNAVLAGETFTCRKPDAERDMIYIEDAARAIAEIVRSDLTGAINIGTGRSVSVRSIAGSIGALVGHEELVRYDGEGAAESDRFYAGIGRLVGELRFTPAFSLRQGLERTIDWWRARSVK